MTSAMTQVLNRARTMLVADRGATAVEYGLMVALIAIVIMGAVALLGGNMSSMFTTVANSI